MEHKPWILLILILGLGVRLYGIQHGYPYSYYPDESHFVKRALSFGSFDFNPHWFHKPAFYMYLLFFEYGIYFVVGKIVGLWVSTTEFAVHYVRNPGVFYMIGRLTTVAFSVGSIWIVYRLGERHFKQRVGLVAALFLSLSFGHVVSSQNIKADTPTMFFTVASMLFLLNYVDSQKIEILLASVVMAGMGAATKEYTIVMLPPIMLGVAFVAYKEQPTKAHFLFKLFLYGLMVFGLFVFVFFICSPYNFLDPLGRESTKMVEVFSRLFRENEVNSTLAVVRDRPRFFPAALLYFRQLPSAEGLGWIIGLLSFLGLVYASYRLDMKMLVFLSFPVLFLLISIIASPGRADTRHQLPLFPFLSLLGGYFVTTLADRFQRYRQVVYLGLSALLVVPLLQILAHGYEVSKPDTRNVAKAWIESNILPDVKVLVDENGPQLLTNGVRLRADMEQAALSDESGQFTAHYDTYLSYQLLAAKDEVAYDLSYIRFPWWRDSFEAKGIRKLDSERDRDMGNPLRPVGVARYDDYIARGFEYAIVQSNVYNGFFKADGRKAIRFPAFAQLYAELFEKGQLIKEFSPLENNFTGPTVKIFRINLKNTSE